MPAPVRRRDESPAWAEDARQLGEPRSRSATWYSIHRGERGVELASSKGVPGRHRPGHPHRAPCELDHPRRLSRATTSAPSSPTRAATRPPAADLQHSFRLHLRDRPNRQLACVRPRHLVVQRLARGEPGLGGVLRPDASGIVGAGAEPHGVRSAPPGARAEETFRRARRSRSSRCHRTRRFVDPSCSVPPFGVEQQHGVLTGMIGRRRRRVAAVVGRDHEQVAGAQRLEDVR